MVSALAARGSGWALVALLLAALAEPLRAAAQVGPGPAATPAATPTALPLAAPRPRAAAPAEASAAPDTPPLELKLSSDRQAYDAQLGRYVASGRVTALVAGGRIQADRLEFDPANRVVLATGSVRFQRGQQYFQASRLRFSLLEGRGEMDDVYGVLDLDGSAADLDLTSEPSEPLPPPQPISCPPDLPPLPDWHPYPWAVTAWGGQMYTANFGDTFLFRGNFRPEYLGGLGLQRRLLDGGPFALEWDTNLLGHRSRSMPGGGFNQDVPFANTPGQTFADFTTGLGLRFWVQPWLSLYFVEGVSLLSEASNYEKTYRENYSTFLNYLGFEVEALFTPQVSLIGRIHHRSGAYGLYSGVSEGSNGYLLGMRYRFGSSPPPRLPLAVPPAQGCPGAPPPESQPPTDLASQLDRVTMGAAPGDPAAAEAGRPADAGQPGDAGRQGGLPSPSGAQHQAGAKGRPAGNLWQQARQREKERAAAIARLDQRVSDIAFEQSLVAERRYGFPSSLDTPSQINEFGGIQPTQLQSLTTEDNRQLVQGTISRWRVQARRLTFTPTSLSADRIALSNDPFTPAQSWLDVENAVATLLPNGDTAIRSERSQLVLDERLPIPVTRNTVIRKQQKVDNRWVLGVDKDDRGGYYGGYNIPIRIGERGRLTLQPQFMIQRAINGNTDSYPLPGQSVTAEPVSQPNTAGDLFGLQAVLQRQVLGFESDATLEISSFNPDNFSNATRAWGDFTRPLKLPLLGESEWRLFGAYRYRVWNGTLGDQDVYSAYGTSVEQTGFLPNWGKLSGNYFWRTGVGNFRGEDFTSSNLADFWRWSGIASFNFAYPLWVGKPAPLTATAAYANSAVPVVPGLSLRANLLGTFAYYGDGSNQNTLGISGGPVLTLGHFVKPYLDYTELAVTGGGTLRQGASPLSFDRAVDLSSVGIGLTQQIAGPLLFSGGVALNLNASTGTYGGVTNSYLELRWQRRAYEIGVYYNPYEGLGGVRVKLNDFNFQGTGLPFVPLNPIGSAWRPPEKF